MEIQLEKCMCYENLCKNLVLISPRYSIFWKLHVMNNLTPRSQEDKISQKLHWGNDTAECDSSLAFPLWTAWSQTPRCRSHQGVKKTKFLKNSIEGMTPRSVTPRCHSHCGLHGVGLQGVVHTAESRRQNISKTPLREWHRGVWLLVVIPTVDCMESDSKVSFTPRMLIFKINQNMSFDWFGWNLHSGIPRVVFFKLFKFKNIYIFCV